MKTVFTQYFRNCVYGHNWMSFSFESQIMRFCVYRRGSGEKTKVQLWSMNCLIGYLPKSHKRKTNQKILIAFYVTILIIQMVSEYIMSNAYLIQKRREKVPIKSIFVKDEKIILAIIPCNYQLIHHSYPNQRLCFVHI